MHNISSILITSNSISEKVLKVKAKKNCPSVVFQHREVSGAEFEGAVISAAGVRVVTVSRIKPCLQSLNKEISLLMIIYFIYRTYHIVSRRFTILLWGEIGRQHVKASLAAAISKESSKVVVKNASLKEVFTTPDSSCAGHQKHVG